MEKEKWGGKVQALGAMFWLDSGLGLERESNDKDLELYTRKLPVK